MSRPGIWQGMGAFTVILTGEVASFVGTGLTSFGIGVRIFQQSGSVTHFALVALSTVLPLIVLSPVVGVLADRFDRRRLLILANLGSAVCSLLLYSVVSADRLAPWHIYPLILASSASSSVIWPTLTAATTMLVPKQQLGRASGMTQTGAALSEIVAPLLAGFLLVRIGLPSLILVDLSTFLFATATLLLVRIPSPPRAPSRDTEEADENEPTGVDRYLFGWRFIRRYPGLVRLLTLFAGQNFCIGLVQVLVPPMVLGFADPEVLGVILSTAGGGLLLGGIVMSLWGGSSRRVGSILLAMTFQSFLLMLGGLRPSAVLVAGAAFSFLLAVPIIVASSQALWQTKVPAEIQGRVFATRRMIAGSCQPFALALAGPLADHVFEPLMEPGGALAATAGAVLGTGPGRGIALLFVVTGVVLLALVGVASRSPTLRRLEEDMPDAIAETPAGS